jgi:hypothetical protein
MQDFWWMNGTGADFSLISASQHHSLITYPPKVCNSPEQTVHYHTSGLKFGASFLTQHLAGYMVRKLGFTWEEHNKV